MRKLSIIVLMAMCSVQARAQSMLTENTLKLDSPENMPEASVEEMAWLTGNWVGEAFGGLAEDIWSEPVAGAMVGMFRSVVQGEVGFYELFTISEKNNSLTLRLKHFNANLTGWEEKGEVQEFPLIKIENGNAWFEGFTILKDGKDGQKIYLAIERADGTVREMEFNYTRRKSSR